MSYSCSVEERPLQPTVSVRRRTPVERLPEVIGPAFGAVYGYLMQLGVQPAGAPYVVYFNMDMQDLDLEIGFPVVWALPGQGEVQAGQIGGGRAATCLHVGPYEQLQLAYEVLMGWMEQNGYVAAGTAIEFYLNDPDAVAPEQLQTQIVLPLA